MTKKIKARPWDVTEHLETEEDMAAYLRAALEEGDLGAGGGRLGGHRPRERDVPNRPRSRTWAREPL